MSLFSPTRTTAGEAWLGDAIETLETQLEDESVDLIVTSPTFALPRPKEYGNETQEATRTGSSRSPTSSGAY